MLLVLLAVGAFFLFSRSGAAPRSSPSDSTSETGIKPGNVGGLDNSSVERRRDDLGTSNVGKAMPSSGGNRTASGWGNEDAEQASKPMPSNSDKKVNGLDGWGAEQVETNPVPNDGVDLRFSGESTVTPQVGDSDWNGAEVPKKKTVTNGDWTGETTSPRN